MPLFDFICRDCGHHFEEFLRAKDAPDAGTCPKCGSKTGEVQIARFRVGGRGDLRETTEFHGCHPSESEHVHHAGCDHGGGTAKSTEST